LILKTYLTILALTVLTGSFAQKDSSFNWRLIDSIPISEDAVWTVDILSNTYISENGTVSKFDSTGVKVFSQSIKSLGGLSSLCVINTMKLVYFSEEQQLLCYMDNTLSQNENCVRLEDRGIMYATAVASSDRSDKLWVLDEINSRLLLIDLESELRKPLILENVRSIIGEGVYVTMVERGGRLYVNNPSSGVYVFDIYGSFIKHIKERNVTSIDADELGVYLLQADNSLHYYTNRFNEELTLILPRENCHEILVKGNQIYLRTSHFVYKYSVEMTN
jgi:hypothetical protein